MLRYINEKHANDGYWVNDTPYCIQAFADDVILIGSSTESLKNILKSCMEFCEKSGMKITPDKCHWLSYMLDENKHRVSSDEELIVNDSTLKAEDISNVLYLGAPFAIKKNTKMEITYNLLGNLKIEIKKLSNSPLSFAQCVDALNRLICPKLDYILLNSVCPMKKIEEFDKFMRGCLCERLKTKGLPVDFFYTHWKDGGLSLHAFKERSQLLQIKTFINMLYSKQEEVRNIITNNIEHESKKRKIGKSDDENVSLFGYLPPNLNDSQDKCRKESNNLFVRALYGLSRLNIGVKLSEEGNDNDVKTLKVYDDLTDDIEKGTFEVKIFDFLKCVNKILMKRHYISLTKLEFKGHTFSEMENSPYSNDFFNVNSYFAPDCVVNFMINARCNNLPTNELLSKNNSNISKKCQVCNSNEADSLMHRLNNCKPKMSLYTERHNFVCKIINEGLHDRYKRSCPPIHENTILTWTGKESLSSEFLRLKPDLWFGVMENNKLNIHMIEVNCPYGGYTVSNGVKMSKLKQRRKEKIEKYRDLVNEIKSKWNADVLVYTIVISSLGVIPKESFSDLKKLMKSKNRTLKATKRISLAVLFGSYNIFYGKDLKPTLYFTSGNTGNNEVEDEVEDSATTPSESDVQDVTVASDDDNYQASQNRRITSSEVNTITPALSDVSSGSETSH